jgi:hypothetical protein
MLLQTGEDASSTRLDARAQGLDIRAAIPLSGEQPHPFLRARTPGTGKQQPRAERESIKRRFS